MGSGTGRTVVRSEGGYQRIRPADREWRFYTLVGRAFAWIVGCRVVRWCHGHAKLLARMAHGAASILAGVTSLLPL
jgi:hypothetical protein